MKKDRIEKGQLKRMVQAVGMVYVFLLLPVCIPFTVQTKEGENRQRIEKAVRTESKNIETEDEADTEDKRIKPKVALTFDDGPSMEYTPMLLEGLKERGVKASFFLIGCNIEKEGNKEIVKQMYADGHLIGNHTFHHVELTSLSREQALIELKETSDLIEEITGETVEYVRPPFGSWREELNEEIEAIPVMWSVDPLDWTTENVEEIVRKVVTDTEENDMILLHDCYKSSVEAALQIVDILKERGFEFVTVDELLLD
ncbi:MULTISPECIES: polysaccharide deacetylase family protein [Lachnospiraceae]|uniref:Polysaccharide deacetylase family protein n=1 Tax=Faecalicatena acetigenes TaxID=2981790 RepID=A0ABT2TDE3_9FIRM|nr:MULTISPECIES: polysaccharide deacetylase family protein [Lachnospiraceae]MCU6748300.1 polysaccharide deacetylase family protein [Faecalicatena acetigenes]